MDKIKAFGIANYYLHFTTEEIKANTEIKVISKVILCTIRNETQGSYINYETILNFPAVRNELLIARAIETCLRERGLSAL